MNLDRDDQLSVFEAIRASIGTEPKLTSGQLLAMSERLEEAITAHSRTQIDALAKELANLFRSVTQTAPAETLAAVQGKKSAPQNTAIAYSLGQLNFAQVLASHAASRRGDDKFVNVMRSNQFAPFIRELSKRDCTGFELADSLNLRPETVSRKLKILRSLGIADCRRDGTKAINFLTPIARTSLGNEHETKSPSVVSNLRDRLAPRYRSLHTFRQVSFTRHESPMR